MLQVEASPAAKAQRLGELSQGRRRWLALAVVGAGDGWRWRWFALAMVAAGESSTLETSCGRVGARQPRGAGSVRGHSGLERSRASRAGAPASRECVWNVWRDMATGFRCCRLRKEAAIGNSFSILLYVKVRCIILK